MAKRKRLRNTTRAEHKRALEKAVGLQAAAMRESQVFLPRLNRRDGKHDGDMYAQVVEAGKDFLQGGHVMPGSRSEKVISYYSRKDVQQAMYEYARGRKISVLRNFRPMFNGSELRKPDDILPIMMFYSQEPKLWPSMHGTISRHDGSGRSVCDLVVEVDFKKSRGRSFSLARPLIRLLHDLDIEFRVKFSGNASPHIIIPAEAFPQKWRNVGRCRGLYGKLLDFFRSQIKQPNTLDGSFRNPSHFLRMPYSLNENTGLVSIPIRVEDYDRFSWEMACPDTAEVMEDWWSSIPEDAPERTDALIEMAFGQRKILAVTSDVGKLAQERLTPRMPDTLGLPIQIGMVKTGEEIAARGEALMEESLMQDALRELLACGGGRLSIPPFAQAFFKSSNATEEAQNPADGRQFAYAIAQKYGIRKADMQLLWQWSERAEAMAYYSRPDVQDAMYSHVRGRCVRIEGMDEYLTLNEPQDVFALAAYMVGGGVAPAFRCTNARYDLESGEMSACDMVIEVDQDLSNSVVLLLRSIEMPSFALYSGDAPLRIVIPYEVLEACIGPGSPLRRLPNLAADIDRHLRRMLKASDGVSVSLYEGSTPILYSLSDDGERVNLPVKLDEVYKLSPDMARASAVGTIEGIGSFVPPDAGEKAARFFNDVIL